MRRAARDGVGLQDGDLNSMGCKYCPGRQAPDSSADYDYVCLLLVHRGYRG